ncbi:TetR/AcrR family transcriptional regulator [Nocardioides speluncae]|uniref:TetR/AcrR family transcriptional regulator n=1 Tax=Nocardioides speluncae TaxID=2670337 RepID=UPI000D6977C1|nr:TetR/AcrR family transcriptional regulator [Nocardioides speluncae]
MTPKSSAAKLLPKVPGTGRRQQYSASTKRALIDVAESLFSNQGYAATSLDAIVAGARVTKGALYHHFSGKQAVFEAVFEKVETSASKRIAKGLKGEKDPWKKAILGLREFLACVQDPAYRRVVIQDGPAVLGYEKFREREQRSSFALVQEIVGSVLNAGGWELDDEMLATFSRIFVGALSSAGESVSTSDDPREASARVEIAMGFILEGLRMLEQAGVELPSGPRSAGKTQAPADESTEA